MYTLLTSWPTLAASPQAMGRVGDSVVEVFRTDGCGAMTTGEGVADETKDWKNVNSRVKNGHLPQHKHTRMNPTPPAAGLPVRLVWKVLMVLQLSGGQRQKLRQLQVRSPAWPRSGPGRWRAAEGWRSAPEDHGEAGSALQLLHRERRG